MHVQKRDIHMHGRMSREVDGRWKNVSLAMEIRTVLC